MTALPGLKFATARNQSRPTLGHRQGAFARVWLRQPLMPWQQLVADVSGELRPDGTPAYPLVVVTVQRQAGKSHLAMAQLGERCFSRPGFRAWYTAQTGGDARDQFLKFADENIAGRPLDRAVTTLRGNGHEVMRFANGSSLRPHPPTEDAMHGKQSDRNDVDEAWAFSELQGKNLLQAISPTQLTRPHAQTFIWSAGGTAASTWLAALVARGRAGDPSMAFFEFGIPDDLDLGDLDAIAHHHPAYGYTITVEAIRNLRAQLEDDAEFARAAGNRWTEVIGGAITADQWRGVRHPDPIPEDAPVGYGAARSADGTQVAIVVAAEVDGLVVVEVLDVLATPHRAAEHVKGWAIDGPVGIDPHGPSAGLADELDRLGVPLLPLSTQQASAACAQLLDAIDPQVRGYRFRPHPALDAAVRVAGKRRVGDGGFSWARVSAGAPVATLEAATWAAWALTHRPRLAAKPSVRFPGDAA